MILFFRNSVYCENHTMLPIGLSDMPGEAMVKLYCPKCQEIYNPKSSRHHHTDGAYFGTGFPVSIPTYIVCYNCSALFITHIQHMLFMVHPEYRPKRPTSQFVARLYGFKIHPMAYQLQQVKTIKIIAIYNMDILASGTEFQQTKNDTKTLNSRFEFKDLF